MAHPVCPSCSAAGIECAGPTKVPQITVDSLVKPEHHKDIPGGAFYFCPAKSCDTVYFDTGGRQIRKDQLSVGVWQKEEPGETLVCYCFGYSVKNIMEDARENSPPEIPFIVRDKIKAGECQCDIKNPRGTCCLGDVAYWVKQAE